MTAVPASLIPVMRPDLGDAEARAAADAVASGWVAQGPRVAAFEDALATAVGAAHGVAVSSCTTALHLALVLLGIGAGDEVIVPSLSFIATANVVRHAGARPVFADVDPHTLALTAGTIEAVRTPRTRAVLLVHQAGTPADIDAVQRICDALGIAVVEDAACALGAEHGGRPIGAHSALVAFSFHPRKVITTGEGGMLMVREADLAARARRLREHAMSVSASARHATSEVVIEEYTEAGFNYRMTDIQAAVGLVQLSRLDAIVARRRDLGRRYTEMLAGAPDLAVNADPPWGRTNFQSYWVLLPDDLRVSRDDVLRAMARDGVMGRRGIMAAHLEPAYADAAQAPLPVTERVARRSLILPLYGAMSDEDQERVVAAFAGATGLLRA